PVGLIGAGRSGELATIDAVRRRGHEAMPERGVLTVTVPGTVEAWGRLIERFGTLGWSPVLEPAAALAQDGYTITSHLSDALKNAAGLLGRESVAHALYPPMDAGMVLRNPDLASVLKDISRHGFNGFYRGEIAAAIAAAISRRDGFVTAQDLAGHRSEWLVIVYPSCARAAAGSSTGLHPSVPKRSISLPHASTVPGTVTVSTPRSGMASWPRRRTASMVASSPDRPAPINPTGAPAPAGQTIAIRSPATDVICGYTTHSTASAAMAASIALPPSRST